MESDQTFLMEHEKILSELSKANASLQKSFAAGDIEGATLAVKNIQVLESNKELVEVKLGWLPSWPPKTSEGCTRWGLTENEVKEALQSAWERHISG